MSLYARVYYVLRSFFRLKVILLVKGRRDPQASELLFIRDPSLWHKKEIQRKVGKYSNCDKFARWRLEFGTVPQGHIVIFMKAGSLSMHPPQFTNKKKKPLSYGAVRPSFLHSFLIAISELCFRRRASFVCWLGYYAWRQFSEVSQFFRIVDDFQLNIYIFGV